MDIKRILILCPHALRRAPGQRFRFEQYIPALRARGHVVKVSPFLAEGVYSYLYKEGHFAKKTLAVAAGFLRRIAMLFSVARFDYVLIYREASPLGPPVFEFLLSAMGKKIIYDFDDAIYIPAASKANRIALWFKCAWKVGYNCRQATMVAVCNPYLVSWVKQYTDSVVLLPTTIDLGYHQPVPKTAIRNRRIVIGWTGSHSTVRYLDLVVDALVSLAHSYDFEFMVICDVDPKLTAIKNYRYVPWCLATEIADLGRIDIGLMPVPVGKWELGKVGFKAIQYSGVGAVPVVSSTGSGHEVVINGETGFVVQNTTDAWVSALSKLLAAPETISDIGSKAREYIRLHYSVEANTDIFLNLFTAQ